MTTIKSNQKDSSAKGTISNPYTEEEYQQLQAEGKDIACYVEGRGFCAPAAMAPPPNPGSPSDPSDPSDPESEPSSEASEPSAEWIFITCQIRGGSTRKRPGNFPSNAKLEVSWSDGTLQSVNPSFLPKLQNVDVVEEDEDEYNSLIENALQIRTFDWTNNFDILVVGTFSYNSKLDDTGRILPYIRRVSVEFTETFSIPDEFRIIPEED